MNDSTRKIKRLKRMERVGFILACILIVPIGIEVIATYIFQTEIIGLWGYVFLPLAIVAGSIAAISGDKADHLSNGTE